MPRRSATRSSGFYSEINPFAAEWLENLIAAGHIAPGSVHGDIRKIDPAAIGDGQAHFFAGIGVWSHALRLAGVPDGLAVWTGSCPCQPFSVAGKRGGADDERHLWPAWFRLIDERRPAVIFGEQVASRDGRDWLDAVFADLETLGYAVAGADLCAAGVGAPHIRQRLFWVADTDSRTRRQGSPLDRRSDTRSDALEGPGPCGGFWSDAEWISCRDGVARPAEPGTPPLADGAPGRVGKLRAYGNAIVAPLAAQFIVSAFDAIEAAA